MDRVPVFDRSALWKGRAFSWATIAGLCGLLAYKTLEVPMGVIVAIPAATVAAAFALASLACLRTAFRPPKP